MTFIEQIRLFLATPLILLVKVQVWLIEIITGSPVDFDVYLEGIQNGDIIREEHRVHMSLIEDMEDELADAESQDEALDILAKYAKMSEKLIEKDKDDGV